MTNGDRCRHSPFCGHSRSGLVPTLQWCGVIVASCSGHRGHGHGHVVCGVVSWHAHKAGWDEGGVVCSLLVKLVGTKGGVLTFM
jgi:hypothetical protein